MGASGSTDADVCIVGAGLTGLAAALQLQDAGRSVHIVDKGRGLGGRLATRRIGGAVLDHGAQFFTVRGDAFAETIGRATAEGIVDVWCHGFDVEDGYPRYYCPAGMTALAKWLAAQVVDAGATIALAEQVKSIHAETDHWSLRFEQGNVEATDIIITAPVPQTLVLLDDGGVEIASDIRAELELITYKPTIGALVTLDGTPDIDPPGAVQQTEEDFFTFIADNQQKGISPEPAVTFHTNGTFSTRRWDDDPAEVLAELLEEAKPWLGTSNVLEAQLKKWKFAGPYQPHPDRCVVAATTPGKLVLAGDGFGGPKVEGAFNSGQAAATALTPQP